jgi:hypothetical protein
MGRFYTGDIEGKFWFAVQSSDDGEFFGAEAQEPQEIDYYVEDLDKVNEGVAICLEKLGATKEKFDEFFKEHDAYNDSMLAEFFNIPELRVKGLLEWYARLELGLKIQKCVQEQGDCSFSAEI